MSRGQDETHPSWYKSRFPSFSIELPPHIQQYGKLTELFGRKPIFLFGVVVFLIGVALSGASQSMNELIADFCWPALHYEALERSL